MENLGTIFAKAHRVKLYNKKRIRIPAHKAWDQFKYEKLVVKKLKNGLLHPSFTGIHMHLDKLNKYSTMLANQPIKKSFAEIFIRIWFGFPVYFFISLFCGECFVQALMVLHCHYLQLLEDGSKTLNNLNI